MAIKKSVKEELSEEQKEAAQAIKNAKRRPVRPYVIHVKGHGLTPLSAAIPADIEGLVKKSSGNTKALQLKIVTAIVDKCIQVNDIEGAQKALNKYQEDEALYSFPLMTFKRDKQNGNAVYMGANSFYGAIRDTIVESFFDEVCVYKKGKKGYIGFPSAKRIRNYVFVKPHHVALYNPVKKERIIEPDVMSDPQQPVGDVKGFSRFEVINPPYEVKFRVEVHPRRPWGNLKDQDLMKNILWYSSFRGIGARRGAGFGSWKIDTLDFETVDDVYSMDLGEDYESGKI